jgi:hypothetical protein
VLKQSKYLTSRDEIVRPEELVVELVGLDRLVYDAVTNDQTLQIDLRSRGRLVIMIIDRLCPGRDIMPAVRFGGEDDLTPSKVREETHPTEEKSDYILASINTTQDIIGRVRSPKREANVTRLINIEDISLIHPAVRIVA